MASKEERLIKQISQKFTAIAGDGDSAMYLPNHSGIASNQEAINNFANIAHNHSGVYEPLKGSDDNYVTDAQLVVIGNTSGTNTGDINIKQTEIDFGATPIAEQSFNVTDADVTAGSQIIGNVAYEAPTGKDLDELDMDAVDLKFAPAAGSFTIYAKGMEGYIADKFKINYLIG